MVANKERPRLQVLVYVLYNLIYTLRSYFPYLRTVFISAIYFAYSPYPRKNDLHWGIISNKFLHIWKI